MNIIIFNELKSYLHFTSQIFARHKGAFFKIIHNIDSTDLKLKGTKKYYFFTDL